MMASGECDVVIAWWCLGPTNFRQIGPAAWEGERGIDPEFLRGVRRQGLLLDQSRSGGKASLRGGEEREENGERAIHLVPKNAVYHGG